MSLTGNVGTKTRNQNQRLNMGEGFQVVSLEESFSNINSVLIDTITKHNEAVARKLGLAVGQLSSAHSVEEFQQIGILMRDCWVEFVQSIYRIDSVPVEKRNHSPTDLKTMLKLTWGRIPYNDEALLSLSVKSFDMANKLEHDLNATKPKAANCITTSALCMVMILYALVSSELIAGRPFYKCPDCGGIRLKLGKQWEQDFDGAFQVAVLTCEECGWQYVDYPGDMKIPSGD